MEAIYDKMAQTIDALPPEQETVFLAKLVLLLARSQTDLRFVEAAIEAASTDLD